MSQNNEQRTGGKRRRRRRNKKDVAVSVEKQVEQPQEQKRVADTKNVWKIKNEQDGGREHYIDGTYYRYGATLPKLEGKLFKSMRQAGYIEVVEDSIEVEQ